MQQQLTQPSWAWILETAAEAFHPWDSSESDPSHSISYKPGSDLQGYLDKQTKNRSVSSLTLCVQYPTSQVLISRVTWTNKRKTEAFHLWPFAFNILQARFWSPGIPEQTKNRSISSLTLHIPCPASQVLISRNTWTNKQKHFIPRTPLSLTILLLLRMSSEQEWFHCICLRCIIKKERKVNSSDINYWKQTMHVIYWCLNC